jgi:hypothetical protein
VTEHAVASARSIVTVPLVCYEQATNFDGTNMLNQYNHDVRTTNSMRIGETPINKLPFTSYRSLYPLSEGYTQTLSPVWTFASQFTILLALVYRPISLAGY